MDSGTLFLEDWSSLAATCFGLVAIYFFDLLLATVQPSCRPPSDKGQRWFFLHTFANTAIVLFGLKDCAVSLSDPAGSMSARHSWSAVPGGFVAAIHLYHPLAFKISREDLFHHLAFALTGCGLNYVTNLGPITNLYFFFVCGLPGGVDYFLLALVKEGRLAPMRQKAVSAFINIWLRGPGLTAVFAFAWAAYRSGDHEVNLAVMLLLLLLAPFNGQYYLQRVVANYHFKLGVQSVQVGRNGILANNPSSEGQPQRGDGGAKR